MGVIETKGMFFLVLVTCGQRSEAETIAETLVRERLAACVNVLGGGDALRSFYWWDGQVTVESEVLLLIKTTNDQLFLLEKRLVALHPYAVPEFIAVPVEAASQAYFAWVAQSVAAP